MRHPTADPGPPVLCARVLVVTSQPVVSAGINGLLVGRHGDLVVTTEGPEDGEPDVVFFDVIELHNGDGTDLDHWISQTSSVVIAVTRELRPDLGSEAVERGAAGAISMGASLTDFLEVIEAAVTGRLADCRAARLADEASRAGLQVGLTRREADIIAMIVQGLSNRDITHATRLSINSIKGYIRSAYRKMDVRSRSQAVRWGVQNGFPLEPLAISSSIGDDNA